MHIYLTPAGQEQQDFDSATSLRETVTVILPNKEIVIDVQSGIVQDQSMKESPALGTDEAAIKMPGEKSQADKPGASNDKILQEWVCDFLKTKQLRWRPKTFSGYTSILNLYVAHVGANNWPPTYQGVLHWLNHVKQGNTETTVSIYWTHLRAFFNYLEKIRAIQPHQNPVHKIKELDLIAERPDLPPVAFPAGDLDRLFASLRLQARAGDIQAIRDLALIRFAYVTGCREAEIAQLSLDCVNMPELEATIRIETTKGKKQRLVYFDEYVQLDLRDWLAVRPDISGV
jgi:integrase